MRDKVQEADMMPCRAHHMVCKQYFDCLRDGIFYVTEETFDEQMLLYKL